MPLPFLHRTSLGVHIAPGAVRAVKLCRRLGSRGTVRLLGTARVAVEGGNLEVALRQVADQLGPKAWDGPAYIVSHVDPDRTRLDVHHGPHLDGEAGSLHRQAQAEALVPLGAAPDAFVQRVLVLHQTEEEERLLAIVARREAVHERLDILTATGLPPSVLMSLEADAGLAYAFAPGFTDEASAVLLLHAPAPSPDAANSPPITEAVLLIYQEGVLNRIEWLTASTLEDARSEAKALLPSPAPGELVRLWISGSSQPKDPVEDPNAQVTPLTGLLIDEPVAPDYGSAAALAVRGLYGELAGVTLVDPEVEAERTEAIERAEAVRAVLATGGALTLVLLALTLANLFLSYRLTEAEAALEPVARELHQIDGAEARLGAQRRRFQQAQALAGSRTAVAPMLMRLQHAVPEGLWLRGLAVQSAEGDAAMAEVRLVGVAREDQALAELLASLEGQPGFSAIRLTTAEALDAEAVARITKGAHRRSLVRFDVHLAAPLREAGWILPSPSPLTD